MIHWQRVSFATTQSGVDDIGYIADQVGVKSAYVSNLTRTQEFYRLNAQ